MRVQTVLLTALLSPHKDGKTTLPDAASKMMKALAFAVRRVHMQIITILTAGIAALRIWILHDLISCFHGHQSI